MFRCKKWSCQGTSKPLKTSFNDAENCVRTTDTHKQLFTSARIPPECCKFPLSYITTLFVMKYAVLTCAMSEGLVLGGIDDDISVSMDKASDAHKSQRRRTREY